MTTEITNKSGILTLKKEAYRFLCFQKSEFKFKILKENKIKNWLILNKFWCNWGVFINYSHNFVSYLTWSVLAKCDLKIISWELKTSEEQSTFLHKFFW